MLTGVRRQEITTSPPGRGGPRPRGFPSTASGTMGLLNWPRGCRPRRAPKNKCSLVFVSCTKLILPPASGFGSAPSFRRPAQSLICAHQKDGFLMLDRRRILAAALAAVAYPVGEAFAQPVPFRPPMPPPRREVRPRHPRGHGPWYWSRGRWRWNGRRWVWVSGRWRH